MLFTLCFDLTCFEYNLRMQFQVKFSTKTMRTMAATMKNPGAMVIPSIHRQLKVTVFF